MTFATPAWVVAVAISVLACGDDPASPEDDDFLPTFTAFWVNTADEDHTFVFQSDDDGLATGSFTGTEDHPTEGNSPVEGTFQNSVATTFIISRASGVRTYTGKFLHADTLRIFRTGESILLARQ